MQVNCLKQYAQRSILGMMLANHVSHGWIRKDSTQAERKTNKLLWSLLFCIIPFRRRRKPYNLKSLEKSRLMLLTRKDRILLVFAETSEFCRKKKNLLNGYN